jgi:hypothetical protein
MEQIASLQDQQGNEQENNPLKLEKLEDHGGQEEGVIAVDGKTRAVTSKFINPNPDIYPADLKIMLSIERNYQ